jgi:hypothetical protein
MPYPFPITDPGLQKALDIALNYLEHTTGRAHPYSETERICALTIIEEWLSGKRHVIWLANKAIVANERARAPIAADVPITVLGTVRRL